MLQGRFHLRFQFGHDPLGQHLAEFHTPLIERTDVPDRALREGAVLVERDEFAEGRGRELLQEHRVGRPVAGERLVRHERVGRALGLHLLRRLTEGECLGLGEDVRHQQIVVTAHRVQRLCEGDEVARDQRRALVDELVEGVLAVGAGFAPIDRPRGAIHFRAVERDPLAVALHRQLLEVRREAFQVLVVGQHRDRPRFEEVHVPDSEQAEQGGQILLERSGAVVLVHRVEPGEHVVEAVGPDGEHGREADGGVHRVTAAHPIPEAEHVGGIDAERGHGLGIGAHRDEVLRHGGRIFERSQQPALDALGVRHRFLRRERLRTDDHERLGRVESLHGLGEVGAVHIREEAEGEVALRVVFERFVGHHGAEVRPADADVHDGANALPREAGPRAGTDAVREVRHAVEHGVNVRHHVLAIDDDRGTPRGAKGRVEHGASFGDVDLVAAEQGVDTVAELALLGELHEQLQRFVGDAVLGVIEEHAFGLGGESFASARILREELPEVLRADLGMVRLQGLPRGEAREGGRHGKPPGDA